MLIVQSSGLFAKNAACLRHTHMAIGLSSVLISSIFNVINGGESEQRYDGEVNNKGRVNSSRKIHTNHIITPATKHYTTRSFCSGDISSTTQHHNASSSSALLSKQRYIKIVEVGPRDGLQNEPNIVSVQTKIDLIHKLYEAGCQHIEATSFVSPKWVPQMADAGHVMEGIRHLGISYQTHETMPKHNNIGGGITLSCLTPNVIGVRRAILAGANTVVVFASASETFSKQNLNCSIDESFERFHNVIEEAKAHSNIPIRGYVSCAWGCPYEGHHVSFDNVERVSTKLMEMGCYEISLCDTIGCATPDKVIGLLQKLQSFVDSQHVAVHFHDTYGQALVNTYVAICEGVATVDSSIGGLGSGCPFVVPKNTSRNDGATTTGNLATEDLVYMLHGMGMNTGLNLPLLCEASQFIFEKLGQTTRSKVGKAMMLKKSQRS